MSILLLALTTIPLIFAKEIEYDGINYIINNSTKTASVGNNQDLRRYNLTIPKSVIYNETTYTVSEICDSAFHWNTNLEGQLTIPETVTKIGKAAFCGCSGFTGNLIIPKSVTVIGVEAFSYCYGFTGSLIIPVFVSD